MNLALCSMLAWSGLAAAASPSVDGSLPPARVALLPVDVVRTLESMRCRIPQSPGTKTPNNVVEGHFLDSRSSQWAVVCLREQRTHILIVDAGGSLVTTFGDGEGAPYPADPAARDDSAFIAKATPRYILQHDAWYGNIPPAPKIEHDGIEVGSDKASTIYYWDGAGWRTLSGAD